MDLTGKDNINVLLFVTNILVTDYSSSVFEATLLQIPMIFYVFDKEEYLENRDIYYDFDTFVPGEQVKTQEHFIEVVKGIIDGDYRQNEEINEKYKWFQNEFLDALSGSSTKSIVQLLTNIVES